MYTKGVSVISDFFTENVLFYQNLLLLVFRTVSDKDAGSCLIRCACFRTIFYLHNQPMTIDDFG